MKIYGLQCPVCKIRIFSFHRHDFKSCGCTNNVFIDGGFDYCRWGFKDKKPKTVLFNYRLDQNYLDLKKKTLILVLGRNPSSKNLDWDTPFLGAPSYTRLKSWLRSLRTDDRVFFLENCTNQIKPSFNKNAIKKYVSKLCLTNIDKVIALGNDAEKVCRAAGVSYFKLPHPSGLNRKLNGREYITEQLIKCDEWLSDET